MDKKELLTFLTSRQSPAAELASLTRKEISLSFRGKQIIQKFLFFQFLGALFSLSVCPQFGLGLVDGHGISHTFRMIGDWACAVFCGSVFLGSGLTIAFIGQKGEEIWWVWKRNRLPLIFLPALFWGALMLANVSLNLPEEGFSYHAIWIMAAMMIQGLLLQTRVLVYFWQLKD